MRAFTFYAELPQFPIDRELVGKWRDQWSRHGWETVVLGEREARFSPHWQWFDALVKTIPTVNPPDYERWCWLRWLAYAATIHPGEVALYTDYDVFNDGFTPAQAMAHANAGRPVNLDAAYGAGPFVLDSRQANAIPFVLSAIADLTLKYEPGTRHWSDMECWKTSFFKGLSWCVNVPVCQPYRAGEKALLVHLSNSACVSYGQDKLTAWKSLEA